MKFFPLLWAGLWRKRTRTMLTLLSVVIAFLLYGLLQGVNSWLNNAIAETRVNRLYTVSRISYIEPLPFAYLTQIESVPGVETVAYFNWFGGSFRTRRTTSRATRSTPSAPSRYFRTGRCRRIRSIKWFIRATAPSSARRSRSASAGRSATACHCSRASGRRKTARRATTSRSWASSPRPRSRRTNSCSS